MRKINTFSIILFFVFVFASFLRLYNVNNLPNGFHSDELDAGYIGRYILLYGKDVFGNTAPLYVDKFGDFRPAGVFYLAGLSTFIFGINEFAVRFPAAIFGSLSVLLVYFIYLELFKSKKGALLASFLFCITPWHIVLSRATSEAIIGLFFVLGGILFLLKSLKNEKKEYVFLTIASFLGSYFFYHTFRLLVPLIILPFLFYIQEKKHKKIILLLFGFFALITFSIALTPWGGGRFSQVAFFKNENLQNTINYLTHTSGETILSARVFHNKGVIYIREFINQYMSYFQSSFLFLQGGLPLRYAIPEQGLLYIVYAPFIIFTLSSLFLKKQNLRPLLLLLYFTFISPLPGALTYEDSPNIHRSIFLVVPFILFASYGMSTFFALVKKYQYPLLFFLGVCITCEFFYFLHQYTTHSPGNRSSTRNDGTKELVSFVEKNKDRYTKIVIPKYDNIPLYFRFYTKNFTPIKPYELNPKVTSYLGNIMFVDTWCPSEKKEFLNKKNTLIVEQGDCKNITPLTQVEQILRKDSTHAFRLLEGKY